MVHHAWTNHIGSTAPGGTRLVFIACWQLGTAKSYCERRYRGMFIVTVMYTSETFRSVISDNWHIKHCVYSGISIRMVDIFSDILVYQSIHRRPT